MTDNMVYKSRQQIFSKSVFYSLIALILAAGWGVRLIGLKYSVFAYNYRRGDEPAAYEKALHYSRAQLKIKNNLPLDDAEKKSQYQSSALLGKGGVLPGPLQNMIIARGMKITGNIEGAHILILVMHCLSIILCWHIAYLLFGQVISLLTVIMASFFFWPVYYSFGMWHPHFIPLVAVLTAWPLACHLKTDKTFWLMPAAFFFTLFFQFHLIGSFLIFFLVFYFICFIDKKNQAAVAILTGITLALAMFYRNYLSFEFSTGFSNLRGLFAHGLFHIEVLKIFSNCIVVGSAEISRIIDGGFPAYREFYSRYMISFFLAAPFILLSLLLPLLAYIHILRETFLTLAGKKIKHWKEIIKNRKELFFLSGWFFIPWMIYLLRLKYHELRFVALDFPVMYAMFAIYIVQLSDKFLTKKTYLLFAVIVCFNTAVTFFSLEWGLYVLKKPPHMIFSLRYYDNIAWKIINDLEKNGKTDYYIEFNRSAYSQKLNWFYDGIIEHIERTGAGRYVYADEASSIYRISSSSLINNYSCLGSIYSVYLLKKNE
ncbi:MAG: hypothetical protein A2096_09740 [Spirochaetes bacterium GWF1_41_5]|nr:MAG: hypothetical protein A2096_09740 [Spirochaetes bacterium GWF1_41_5]HBE03316.1 hypothetical protein [Spirochaetia bacterium]